MLFYGKDRFPVMAEITRILAANIPRQFFFVVTTTASTRYLVQNFQPICYLQRVSATSQYNDSGETLLAACTKKKRLQRKMTKDYHWIGVQENIGMFSILYSDRNSLF